MRTIRDVLQEADPVRHEANVLDIERDRVRRALTGEASRRRSPAVNRFWPAPAALIVVAILALIVVGVRFWPVGPIVQAAVGFEVRLAEDRPGPGLHQARIEGADRVIYLQPQVIVSNGDVVGSAVIDGDRPSRFHVAVKFSAAGAERMRTATAGRRGKPLAILVDGRVVAAPVVRGPIGDSAVITGDYTRAQAERIAKGIRVP